MPACQACNLQSGIQTGAQRWAWNEETGGFSRIKRLAPNYRQHDPTNLIFTLKNLVPAGSCFTKHQLAALSRVGSLLAQLLLFGSHPSPGEVRQTLGSCQKDCGEAQKLAATQQKGAQPGMSGPATASGNIAASQPETAEEDSAEVCDGLKRRLHKTEEL
jgi:hypothetical protein